MSGGDEFILIPYVDKADRRAFLKKVPEWTKTKFAYGATEYIYGVQTHFQPNRKRGRRFKGSGSYKNNHTHRIQTGHLIQQRHQGKSKEIRGTAETEKTCSFIKTQSAVLSGCTTVLTVWLNF